MQVKRKTLNRLALILVPLTLAMLCIAFLALYPIFALRSARSAGVYAQPQDYVYALAERSYCGVDKVVIEKAGPNAFDGSNPHVWFIIYRIYADQHAPCDSDEPGTPMFYDGYDTGGQFVLQTKDGWVFMPEGVFPDYVGLWMKVFNQAGPGLTTRLQ